MGVDSVSGYLLDMRPRGAGGGSSGAPIDATYITQTPNATLTNEQALSLLATGLLKNTTGTGVLSIATPTVDFASAAQGALADTSLQPGDIGVSVQSWDADLDTLAALAKIKGNLIAGTGATWQALPVGADGLALVADSLEATGLKWAAIVAGVSSVFGRTGAVIAALNDYPASFITNTPAGGIASIDVQGALNELDTEKAAISSLATVAFSGAYGDLLGLPTLGTMAAFNDAPSDGSTYGRNNGAWAAVAAGTSPPFVDETAIVYKTGNIAITQTHDINAYSAARVVTWPDAAMTPAGLGVANVFTTLQKINVNNALALLVEQDGVRDNVLVVDTANGRVGVNTVPSVAFHVAETMYLTSAASNPILELRGVGASSICLIDFSQGGTDYDGRIMLFSDGTFRIIQNDNNELQFYTSNSLRMRIGGGGHVAINKAVDTSYFLDVSGTARATTFNATTSIVINDGTITKLSGNYFDWTTGIRLNALGGRQLVLGGTTVNTGNDYSIVSADKFSVYVNGYTVEAIRVLTDGKVGINDTTPDAKLDIVQSSTTAAIPVLKLEQLDLSEEFIRFESTVGAGNPIDTAALGAYYGKIRVYVEGVGAKWLALYD